MTYYISTTGSDLNTGTTLATAFLTWTKAESVVNAGDTVLINDGTYSIGAPFTASHSGTAGNYIYFKAINPGSVSITANNKIYIEANYRWFHGFNFTMSTDLDRSIWIHRPAGSTNNRITDCTVHVTVATGYAMEVGHDDAIQGVNDNNNLIENCRILSDAVSTGLHGIIFGGTTGSILRNTFFHNSYYGLVDKGTTGTKAYNNVFSSTVSNIFTAFYAKGATSPMYYNNTFRRSAGGYGVVMADNPDLSLASTGVQLSNNIYVGTDPAYFIGANVFGPNTFTSDYNDFSGPVAFDNDTTTSYPDLATWQADFSQDLNSISGTPTFLNGSSSYSQIEDFKPSPGSVVIDLGITVAGRTTDAGGFAITGTPDIGAYELSTGHIYYISTSGNDANPGTLAQPWRNFEKLTTLGATFLHPGDIVYVRAGTYLSTASPTTFHNVDINNWAGTALQQILVSRYPPDFVAGGRVVYDCTNVDHTTNAFGIVLTGCSFVKFFGISVVGPGQTVGNGIICGSWWHINSPNCTLENCEGSYTMTPFRLDADPGAGDNMLYLNDDAHHASDPYTGGPTGPWNNSDGFSRTNNHAANVVYRGCRSWFCSDDGWDSIHTVEKITYDGCWSIMNGYSAEGVPYPDGDGNGFKMGGGSEAASTTVASRFVNRCVAIQNRNNGFDQNDGIFLAQMFNNDAINNGVNDWKFGYHQPIAHILKNNLSFGNAIIGGVTSDADFWVHDHNSWNGAVTIDGSDFINLTASEFLADRQTNGNLPIINAAHLAPGSDLIDAGVDVGLPFAGLAPDMGAFETGLVESGSGSGVVPLPSDPIASLIINFIPCDPAPPEGYQILYRAIGDVTYIDAGFFTSSPAIIGVAYPAGTPFEGIIRSDCGDVAWSTI